MHLYLNYIENGLSIFGIVNMHMNQKLPKRTKRNLALSRTPPISRSNFQEHPGRVNEYVFCLFVCFRLRVLLLLYDSFTHFNRYLIIHNINL